MTQPLLESLSEWCSQLTRGRSTEDTSSLINVSSFLRLGYHAVRTLLFRALMRPFHNARYASLSSGEEYDAVLEQVRAGAKACCVDFLAYIRELDSQEFHSFWPFCTFRTLEAK